MSLAIVLTGSESRWASQTSAEARVNADQRPALPRHKVKQFAEATKLRRRTRANKQINSLPSGCEGSGKQGLRRDIRLG
jgi:hypothetical protein